MSHKTDAFFDYALLTLCLAVLSLVWAIVWVIPNDARNLQISQCQLEKGDRSFEAYKACALESQVNEHQMADFNHNFQVGDRVKMRDCYQDVQGKAIMCWLHGTIIAPGKQQYITCYDIIFDDGTRRSISHGSVFPIADTYNIPF